MKTLITTIPGKEGLPIINEVEPDKIIFIQYDPEDRFEFEDIYKTEYKFMPGLSPDNFICYEFSEEYCRKWPPRDTLKELIKLIKKQAEKSSLFISVNLMDNIFSFLLIIGGFINISNISMYRDVNPDDKEEWETWAGLKLDISETKLKILSLINKGVNKNKLISQELGISPQLTSKHLKELKDMVYIKKTPGKTTYELAGERIRRPMYVQVLVYDLLQELEREETAGGDNKGIK